MADDRRTEIGPDTLVSGDIEAREDIAILGRVEGTATSTHTVTIEEGGVVQGRIRASQIVIAGALVGQAEASERIEITETGRVLGTVATPRLVLLDGGAVQGDVVMDGSGVPDIAVAAPAAARAGNQRTASSGTAGRRTATTQVTRTGREAPREAPRTSASRAASTSRSAPVRAPARPVVVEAVDVTEHVVEEDAGSEA